MGHNSWSLLRDCQKAMICRFPLDAKIDFNLLDLNIKGFLQTQDKGCVVDLPSSVCLLQLIQDSGRHRYS